MTNPKVPQTDLLVWVDIETTGLDSNFEVPLEIGLMVTNLDGHHLASVQMLVLHHSWADKMVHADTIVQDMHTESGLWQDIQDAAKDHDNYKKLSPTNIDELLVYWLDMEELAGQLHPMCGSTINFDRAFLEKYFPNLFEWFHYRNIDVSSIKTLCERLNPEVYAKKDTTKGNHRVLEDIRASVNEYVFYKNNFLFTTK